jgi:ring-1,2-phenylacetyl-CoA epoxidase subunit PaaE
MDHASASLLDRIERALPRGLAERVALARRDAAMVLVGLSGRQPDPVVYRRALARSVASAPARGARSVRVREVTRETADAVSLVLEDPTGAPFHYAPGQFFTVCATVDGVALRRAYSASGALPGGATLRITVKRVAGGAMSTWLTTRAAAGDALALLGPSGSFVADAAPGRARHAVLLGGGSGVTPLYAIACAVLRDEPASRVSLVYGNRARDAVILADALDALAARYPDRFAVRHLLEAPHEGFDGVVGRLDEGACAAALDALDRAGDAPAEYYLCGPEPMRAAVRRALAARGVDPATVREEVYTSPRGAALDAGAHTVTLRRRGAAREVAVQRGETILDAALRAGVDMPFSCTVGGCGACQCARVEGEVTMDEPNCLRDDERAAGAVLTCVARPRGPVVLEVP